MNEEEPAAAANNQGEVAADQGNNELSEKEASNQLLTHLVHSNVAMHHMLQVILHAMQPKKGMEAAPSAIAALQNMNPEEINNLVSELGDKDKNSEGFTKLIIAKHTPQEAPKVADDQMVETLEEDNEDPALKIYKSKKI